MELMQHRGLPISRDAIYRFLQECIKRKNMAAGRHVHSIMIGTGMDSVAVLGDFLIQLYASCGSLAEANVAFCRVSEPSVHTWHAIISAHVKLGTRKRALVLYYEMQKLGIPPNRFIFLCILKACCSSLDALEEGMHIHGHIIQTGIDSDVIIGTTLVDMYAKCGNLQEAHKVFVKFPQRDAVLWGALIAGYVQHGQDLTALELFEQMQDEGLNPDRFTYSCILKACGNIRALRQGREIHDRIITCRLESDKVIGSTLIDMYVKCGNLEEACKVFDLLPERDNVLWSTMIAGYAQHGHGLPALELFVRMQKEGIRPDKVMYSCALKACASIGDVRQGRLLQEVIIRTGIEREEAIGNALVDMYSKCGSLQEAQKVFERMPRRSVVSWNLMITTYADLGSCHLSIELFMKMQQEGIHRDYISVLSTLKACSMAAALEEGRLIHDYVIKTSTESDAMVQNTLIDMYAKCGNLDEACKVFDKTPNKDPVSWNAMIAGSAHHGHHHLALVLFAEMQDTGVKADRVTFFSILKACSSEDAAKEGFLVHSQIIEYGLESDVVVGSTLVDMYCKCGLLEEAGKTFDKLPNRNVVSWNSMIAGYAQQGHGFLALEHFEKMEEQCMKPDAVTFLGTLKACGMVGARREGRLIHSQIIVNGHDSDVVVGNTLVDMYVKCASLREAHYVFDSLIHKDVVSWNAMIAGYARPEHGQMAFELFHSMQREGIPPDQVTFLCIIKACSSLGVIEEGRSFHAKVVKLGLESMVVISSALLDMYGTYGSLKEAQKILHDLPSCDLVSCNEMVAGYVNHGHALPALNFFEEMQEGGIQPDKITFSSILRACSCTEALGQGRVIHDQMTRSGIEVDEVVGSTLVDMYVKCGSLAEARQVFDEWQNRDIVMWSAMIGGYVLHDHSLSALELFSHMLQEGLQPDQVIFACILKACGSLGAMGQGMMIHDQIIRIGLESDAIIGSSLIDMYGKVGSLGEARKVFDFSPHHSLESWSAMIAGYAQQGNCGLARKYMENMQHQGWKPDEKTYTSILAGCSHAAEVDEGHWHFQSMIKDHGIMPGIHHFNCMVDLLGRAGRLDEAEKILQTLPLPTAIAGWMSLLTACRTFGNSRIGRQCFGQLVQRDPNGATGYALMSNIYADLHTWDSVCETQGLKKNATALKKRMQLHLWDSVCETQGLKKNATALEKTGMAWIEVKDRVNEFLVGDKIHAQTKDILAKLERQKLFVKCTGHVPGLDCISEHMLHEHDQFDERGDLENIPTSDSSLHSTI